MNNQQNLGKILKQTRTLEERARILRARFTPEEMRRLANVDTPLLILDDDINSFVFDSPYCQIGEKVAYTTVNGAKRIGYVSHYIVQKSGVMMPVLVPEDGTGYVTDIHTWPELMKGSDQLNW